MKIKLARKESFVEKGNRLIAEGKTPFAMQTVIDGCNHYQNEIIKAVNPYPAADAALMILALQTYAEAILKDNPNSVALVRELQGRLKVPEFQTKSVVEKTKIRK